jgi:hypothetical protein
MRIIKFKLTPDQEEAIRPLLTMAALADENKERGLIIGQVVGGYAHCTFLEHETAVNVCAAKAGLAKPSALIRRTIEKEMAVEK